MKKLYRHIDRDNFVTLNFTSGAAYDAQELYPPIRCFPYLFESGVVTDGQIDFDKARRELERKLPHLQHDMICLDVESQPLFAGKGSRSDDPAEWQQFVDVVLPLLEVLRSVDDTLKWSIFGCCPSLVTRHINGYQANRTGECHVHKDDPQESRYKQWLNAVACMKFQAEHLAPFLDWYNPDLYPCYWHSRYAKDNDRWWYFWDDHSGKSDDIVASFAAQTEEWHVMRDCTNVGLSVARHLLPNKPMVPILGMQWYQDKTEPWMHERWDWVSQKWVRNSLLQIRTLADAVAVWAQPNKVGMTPEQYYAGLLWSEVRRFAAQQAQS